MPETMAELVDYLISVNMATRDTILPCSPAEVEEVRQTQGVDQLPPQYEQFLLTMGRRAGDLLRGTDFFYPAIVELADEMRELVVENNCTHLVKPDSTLIGHHQGVELYWMEPSGATYECSEVGPNPTHNWPTLLHCLMYEAETELRIRERIKQREQGMNKS
jgi:hypothetical protein